MSCSHVARSDSHTRLSSHYPMPARHLPPGPMPPPVAAPIVPCESVTSTYFSESSGFTHLAEGTHRCPTLPSVSERQVYEVLTYPGRREINLASTMHFPCSTTALDHRRCGAVGCEATFRWFGSIGRIVSILLSLSFSRRWH